MTTVQSNNTTAVVLVHGLWLGGWAFKPLASYLEKAGFQTRHDSYSTTSKSPEDNARSLIQTIRELDCESVHLVGHSLGGLVALTALRLVPDLPPGRVVMLASPVSGSAAARAVERLPGGDWLLGESRRVLSEGWQGVLKKREVGLIAGKLPVGLGGVFAGLDGPHDGTVAVAETRHAALTDHLILPVSHMSILVSRQAQEQVLHFLREGRFKETGQ